MTENTADAIRAALITNGHALAQAREDAALYERLSAAPALAAKLAKEGNALTAKLSKALADEENARILAVADQYRNFRVTVATGEGSLTTATVAISYERLRYSINTRQNEWTPEDVPGFHYVDEVVLRYLTKHKADLIPASIMALAPSNAWEAVQRFVVARGRNFA